MNKSSQDPAILEKLELLEAKFNAMGQDLSSYLDGLLYADYLTYWDYIHLDTLLSLQTPRTPFPDEQIFITYHQITELYFKLILAEMSQISAMDRPNEKEFLMRLQRVNRYFQHLAHSFDIMVEGMEPSQFLKFRMSLLPASGFQSAQYRLIEIQACPLINLVHISQREKLAKASVEEQYEQIYWKFGATELATGKKTLTLNQFEKKYSESFIQTAKNYLSSNIGYLYEIHYSNTNLSDKIKHALREFDVLANINWPLSHYKSAVRYLQKDPEDIAATGGTNWQKYLPPRFQKVMFFPKLWAEAETSEWGKAWVVKEVFNQ
ncbi:tryptophan 2,3-dioxygenase family protein [Cytophagales bacterium LB-30]|uniref:Tryptophan 2,3-dioxygenase family protein n=1 Tax=Shiella aurantiaca TaxID=3058365 RepID=A0ABT8F0I1_9BACT|nr:tryptophan 2,3-dioxygenase family protein [Shiella aurantiaca]MDN4163898.1 tryptophan 2,3-dioxygenase family protein [Shiella aurantiaca]